MKGSGCSMVLGFVVGMSLPATVRAGMAQGPPSAGEPAEAREPSAADAKPPLQPPTAPVPAEPSTAADGPVRVTTKLEPSASSIGDVLELQVIVTFPRGYSVNLPLGLEFAPMHWVETQESEIEPTGKGSRKVFTLRLQHFAVGEAATPSFPLTYVTPEGDVQTLTVPAHPFQVESLLANETDPQRKPEDPPISLEYPNRWVETVVYSVVGTAGLLLLLWLLFRRLFGRPKAVPVAPPVPPHDRAILALAKLAQEDLPGAGRFQEYYLRLTEIVREYLEGRFAIEALDRTTEEIRRDLVRHEQRIAPIKATELVRFLQNADLVKFARRAPTESEGVQALAYARDLVHSTMPKPETSAGEAKGTGNSEADKADKKEVA